MKVTGFIWLPDIVTKIRAKHQTTPDEAESVFQHNPRIFYVEEGDYNGEDLYSAWGQTNAGRYLIVFFIKKREGRILPLSVREMTRKEQKRYAKK